MHRTPLACVHTHTSVSMWATVAADHSRTRAKAQWAVSGKYPGVSGRNWQPDASHMSVGSIARACGGGGVRWRRTLLMCETRVLVASTGAALSRSCHNDGKLPHNSTS